MAQFSVGVNNKGIDSVVQALVGAGLIELLARTKPVLTYKTRGECCE